MKANGKITGKASSMPAGIGLGTVIIMLITLIGAMLAAWMLDKQIIPEDAVGYISLVILLASSSMGAFIAVNRIKHRKMMVCMVCAGCYYMMLLMCTALAFGGQYTGMGVTALAVMGSALAVGLISIREKKRRGNHRIQRVTR